MERGVWLIPMLATMMVQAVLALGLFALPVVAPQAALAIGVSPAWVGFYSAIVFACAIVSALAAGGPVRRWGAVRTGQLCLALGAISALLAGSGQVLVMVGAAIILGVGFGPETPAASHVLARVTNPRNRPLVFSLKQAGIQLGGVVAGLLFPFLVSLYGWRSVMLAALLASLGAAFALQPLRERYDADRNPRAPMQVADIGTSLGLVLGNQQLRALAIAGFCFSALQQCLSSYLVVYLVHKAGQPLAAAGLALAVAQGFGIVSRIGSGAIAGCVLSSRAILISLGTIMTFASFGLAQAQPDWRQLTILAICAAFGFSSTGWNGIFLAEVARLAPAAQTSDATGGILAAAYGGLLFGPALFGSMVSTGFDYATGYLIMASLGLVGTVAIVSAPARSEEEDPRLPAGRAVKPSPPAC